MKKYILFLVSVFALTSCSDFLDRAPGDALSPGTFWETENDAKLALTGCYRGFEDSYGIMYRDCGSDNAYNFHRHEGYQAIGDGTMSPGDPGTTAIFSFVTIRKCNEFLENIDRVNFRTEGLKTKYVAEVRFIRAYRHFLLTQWYGDSPLVTKTFATPEEARVGRDPKATVEDFVISELKEIIPSLAEKHSSSETGRIPQGAAQALLMRIYLFKGMYKEAIEVAKAIQGYSLFPSFEGLFLMANRDTNGEAILQYEHIENNLSMDLTPFLPNSQGGWSSVVPLQSLVDNYEMADGSTIAEAKAAGKYDDTNPYVNRDPRLRQTLIYPGQLWEGEIFSSVVSGNADHPTKENNSTKSGYNFKKYFNNLDQFPSGFWNTGRSIMIFRYAEVLLTLAEAKIELNQLDTEMYDALDKVRTRAGMPAVDRTKYNTQAKLRELVRRERRSEFAFEGLRRYDIIRWGLAHEVMNGDALGCRQGTILDEVLPNGDRKVNLNGANFFVEKRKFADKNIFLPIPQSSIDKNNNLLPNNPGY
ncbi:RagB/SusD family nutrient uptake outer membrane protein [Dysgonomonas sp. GY617]|uniref:RagB/SusD family nutrient uptake outer membrane protein n=1 Tax=Dysgonomonas sp. GY617 TaxID=2780420 RepID=UPI00188350A4|nr:RagB/SusD family nutrient uptake outer membrane protein [Dysgonomonas sp. GY617]MBF0576866.1 RagB/SusD family nutrient uptake outer membrane protein [Dysgonomonas sp. GY617]